MTVTPTVTPTPLPHGLTDPLRMLEPSPFDGWMTWLLRALVLLALLLAWRWWRRRRRNPRSTSLPTVAPPVNPGNPHSDFIDELRQSFDGTGRYREGCHALASALRDYFGRELRRPLTSWTAREIGVLVRDQDVAGLFKALARLQYRRRDPGRGDFLAACDRAKTVVAGDGA